MLIFVILILGYLWDFQTAVWTGPGKIQEIMKATGSLSNHHGHTSISTGFSTNHQCLEELTEYKGSLHPFDRTSSVFFETMCFHIILEPCKLYRDCSLAKMTCLKPWPICYFVRECWHSASAWSYPFPFNLSSSPSSPLKFVLWSLLGITVLHVTASAPKDLVPTY